MPNYFKLDSNVDLTYIDSEGNEKIVKDAIQVVSGTDGSETITNDRGIIEDYTVVNDLTSVKSISGRGIIFDSIGDIVAKKGNIVLRDGIGNNLTVSSIKYNNIKENSIGTNSLRDKSLVDVTNGTKDYITVNQILASAQKTVLSAGNGNVVQASNKKDIDSTISELLTIPLSKDNQVLVKCKINVAEDAYITLSDTTISGGEVELAQTQVKTTGLTCAYITYSGQLEHLQDDVNFDTSKVAVYNSFYKRFFTNSRQTGDTYTKDSPHKLTLASTVPFSVAYMNIIVSDNKANEKVINGSIILNNQNRYTLKFEDEFEDDEYIISSLDSSEPISIWWSDKKSSGFVINLDRNFSGTVYWEAIK